MINEKAQEILDFWFKETSPAKHFKKDENQNSVLILNYE